jgi:S-adenosylmethionine hydrolase
MAVRLHGHTFLTPDNGLLSFLLKSEVPEEIFEVSNRELWAEHVSPTFHGRDIFAPVAAHLASGVAVEKVGPRRTALMRLDISSATPTERGIRGEIVSVDRFGNLVTNIREDLLPEADDERRAVTIRIGGHTVGGIRRTYADVQLGELVAYVGSSGLLEIGRNRGSARDVLGAGIGHPVRLSFGE